MLLKWEIRLHSLFLRKKKTPEIVEVDGLDDTRRSNKGYGSAGVQTISQESKILSNQLPKVQLSNKQLRDPQNSVQIADQRMSGCADSFQNANSQSSNSDHISERMKQLKNAPSPTLFT